MLDGMESISQEELARMARHGSIRERITVASRTYVSQATLEWLITNDPADEIKTEIIARSDVTPERLVWASQTDNANILGRVAGHHLTPLQTVKDIKAKADAFEGEVWVLLSAFAGRVIRRRETGESEFMIRGKLPDAERPVAD